MAQRHLSALAEQELQSSLDQQMAAAVRARQVRQMVLVEICDSLARQPRIHAALEDDALDLLYPSAHNELRQLTRERSVAGTNGQVANLRARFYRFLNADGALIPPTETGSAGTISLESWPSLTLSALPTAPEFGYLIIHGENGTAEIVEFITVPIISHETFQPIAALVVGFSFELGGADALTNGLETGVWLDGELTIGGVSAHTTTLGSAVVEALQAPRGFESAFTLSHHAIPYRVVTRALNPNSVYPLAREVSIASMASLGQVQKRLRIQILGAGSLVVLCGITLSHFLARRLSQPVEALAEATEEERLERVKVESALDRTSRELERAAHFSADASHQLKTPVAVMRAGLEELLVDNNLPSHLREEVEALIRQTGRLTSVIEDLLLLSRLDAGRLQLALSPQPLHLLIEGLLDDFSILPEADELTVERAISDSLWVQGDRCYTSMILQSLLENARKYNRARGRIRIEVRQEGKIVRCLVGNTGSGISPTARSHIFERFHRGSTGENVPGYGLGLNLAHELARLHGGELRLLASENDWTVFELRLLAAEPALMNISKTKQ